MLCYNVLWFLLCPFLCPKIQFYFQYVHLLNLQSFLWNNVYHNHLEQKISIVLNFWYFLAIICFDSNQVRLNFSNIVSIILFKKNYAYMSITHTSIHCKLVVVCNCHFVKDLNICPSGTLISMTKHLIEVDVPAIFIVTLYIYPHFLQCFLSWNFGNCRLLFWVLNFLLIFTYW